MIKTETPPKADLEELYSKLKSQSKIGEVYGVTQKVVFRWLRDLGIKSWRNDLEEIKGHRFFRRWVQIMQRCYNPSNKFYYRYGGRGILVSDEFKDGSAFLKYITSLPGFEINGRTSLDRIDNNRGYERGNLRWATPSTQVLNRGIQKNNKSGYTGVCLNKKTGKWQANINHAGKYMYIGIFNDSEQAAQARNKFIKENNLII